VERISKSFFKSGKFISGLALKSPEISILKLRISSGEILSLSTLDFTPTQSRRYWSGLGRSPDRAKGERRDRHEKHLLNPPVLVKAQYKTVKIKRREKPH